MKEMFINLELSRVSSYAGEESRHKRRSGFPHLPLPSHQYRTITTVKDHLAALVPA